MTNAIDKIINATQRYNETENWQTEEVTRRERNTDPECRLVLGDGQI